MRVFGGLCMNPRMWNAVNNKVSRGQILAEHMRVLEEAVKDCELYDIRTPSVYEALDCLQALSNRTWGFTVFRQGLEQWNPSALQEGIKLIKQHLGN